MSAKPTENLLCQNSGNSLRLIVGKRLVTEGRVKMYTEINKSLRAGNMDDLNLTCPWVYNGSPDTTCLREVEDMEIRLYVQ